MKNKRIAFNIIILVVLSIFVACGTENKQNQDSVKETNENKEIEENVDNIIENTDLPKEEENNDGINNENIVSKIEGRREEFLERLDNIQKEIDALPEKKDSDAGVTNAMKNYYGRAYEMYDKELNYIYSFLQKELSKEVMDDLEQEEIKWIEEKENAAKEESLKYKGGTFEFVADKISLYQSTKNRCYELVNNYMTD